MHSLECSEQAKEKEARRKKEKRSAQK